MFLKYNIKTVKNKAVINQ